MTQLVRGIPKNFPQYEDVKDLYPEDVPPFEIIPPPKMPSASQRRGTGWIHPNLPQLPMTLIILGPRKKGKSVALRNMLDSKQKGSYGSALIKDNIILYSPNKEFDETLASLELKHMFGPPDSLPAIVDQMFRQQEKHQQQDNMADVLLTVEDCTVVPEAWDLLRYLGYAGRHKGIHTIAVCHKLTAVDRGIRTQQQQWMIFKPHEESERDSILDSFSAKGPSRDIWRKALHRAWNIPYNFVYIDFERGGDMRQVYRSGFNESLFTDEEIAQLEYLEEHGYKTRIIPTKPEYAPGEEPQLPTVHSSAQTPQVQVRKRQVKKRTRTDSSNTSRAKRTKRNN